jgi:hypothetical protein
MICVDRIVFYVSTYLTNSDSLPNLPNGAMETNPASNSPLPPPFNAKLTVGLGARGCVSCAASQDHIGHVSRAMTTLHSLDTSGWNEDVLDNSWV